MMREDYAEKDAKYNKMLDLFEKTKQKYIEA